MGKYISVNKHKGIRKNIESGTFLATKYINKQAFSKSFSSLKQAIDWRANFHPSKAKENESQFLGSVNNLDQPQIKKARKLNGEDLGYSFEDLWKLFQKYSFSRLEKSTQEKYLSREAFIAPLFCFKMVDVNSTLIDWLIDNQKKEQIKNNPKRFCFDNDLRFLKAMLNWYRENYDAFFINPILKRHYVAGIIKPTPFKNKKMRPEDLIKFLNSFESEFWRDFAELHFFMAARVGEIAGLQRESIHLQERSVVVQHVAVWSYSNKKFDYLKEYPKNGEVSYTSMNDQMFVILSKRLAEGGKKGFLFLNDQKPLSYRQIQYQYNKALKKAGLSEMYSSTHIMRHSMGTITRNVTGSIDSAQAVTRHKDTKTAEKYASMPTRANREAVNMVGQYIEKFKPDPT